MVGEPGIAVSVAVLHSDIRLFGATVWQSFLIALIGKQIFDVLREVNSDDKHRKFYT
jgi:hypothetical protein